MKALYLIKKSTAEKSFELRETPMPVVTDTGVLIKTEAFGLNYADIMGRLGLYPEMPPIPCVMGYDVCGEVVEVGKQVTKFKKGDHVVALTRFGGYAEYALSDERACIIVDPKIEPYKQLAFATQLSTSYCAGVDSVNMHPGDTCLIYAAAGGVGLGLVQIALANDCKVIAVASSAKKLDFLKSIGVQDTINYKEVSLFDTLKDKGYGRKIDFIFDSVGGDYIKPGMKLLNSGGKYVLFGASKLSGPSNKIGVAFEALKFGLTTFSPPQFLMPSKGMIGINMLSLGDNKPQVVERSMAGAYQLYQDGVFKHIQGQTYNFNEFVQAQNALESGQSMGKLAVRWNP